MDWEFQGHHGIGMRADDDEKKKKKKEEAGLGTEAGGE